jgi:hypothetical protein
MEHRMKNINTLTALLMMVTSQAVANAKTCNLSYDHAPSSSVELLIREDSPNTKAILMTDWNTHIFHNCMSLIKYEHECYGYFDDAATNNPTQLNITEMATGGKVVFTFLRYGMYLDGNDNVTERRFVVDTFTINQCS